MSGDLVEPRRLKALAGEWTSKELGRFFWFTPADLLQVRTCRGAANRLGFALNLLLLRFLHYPVPAVDLAPPRIVQFVAMQLNVHPDVFVDYSTRHPQTRDEPLVQIRSYLKLRPLQKNWRNAMSIPFLLCPDAWHIYSQCMKLIIHNVPLFYESYGTGTPILFLHGAGCDHRFMSACMEPVFAQQPDWQRIYLDLPGLGQTPSTESLKSSDDMLAVVVDFIDAVIPGQPFLLVGFSYGGYLSQAVLHRKFKQVAGLALICPGVNMDPTQRDAPPQTVLVENPALLAGLDQTEAEEFAARAVVQSPSTWERFRDEMLSGASLADQAFLARLRFGCSFDVAALPQPFPRPVLLLTGRQDHIAGYRNPWRILENYPRGTFAVLDRAGHLLPIEQPQLFNAFISEWLDRVRETL